ncbi:DUF7557 family protein [Halococcus saccharolyticus]|uniref:DUF7557 family protein n=1 Tax=Halococcus saccharolyticus TaxID=62319 RepID=UPI0026BC7BD8
MAPTERTQRPRTTITVQRDLYKRLEGLKPYKSMSYNEFLSELADTYEQGVQDQ